MRNVILLLLGLTCVGLTKSISQCDDYPFMLDISGFTCGNETGTICIVTNYDAWLPCEDIYEEFGFQITYPEPNFIYTDLDPSYYIPFADVSDPIGNPGTTTLYAYQEFPLQDINIVACFEGVLQTPNTVFTLSIVNDEDPSIVLNTVNFTIDNAVTIGNPNTPTLLSSWIAPNGPLLPSAQAAVTGQFVEVVGDIIVDVNYNFGTAQFGGGTYNDITMWPGTRMDITSGHTLATAFTNIHGCGSSWSRINIQGGGTFDTRFTTIRDATVAVEMQHNSTYNVRTKTDIIGNVTGIGSYGTTTKQVSLNVLTNFGNYTAVISDGTEGIHFEHVALVTVNKPLFIQNMSKAGLYLDNADFSGQYVFFTDCKDGTIVPTKNDFLSLDNCDTYFGESGVETYGTKELIVTNGAYSNLITGVAIGDLYGNSHSLIEHNTMGFSNYNVLGILAPSAGEIQYNSMTATNCNVFLWGAGAGDHKWAIQRNPQMWVQGAGQNIYLNYTNNARVFRNDEVVLSEIGRNFTVNGGSNNKIDYNLVSADKDNMQLIGSPMSLIACNRATDGSQGLVVTNDNAGVVIRGNDFTSSGLNLSYGNSGNTYAHTGEQKLKGNLFDLSSSSNKKARNFSAAAVASNNRYLVGFFRTQGDEFFPFFTANIPDWFKNAEVGDYVCPSPPIIGEEDPDIKQTYKRAAHSGIDLLEAGVGSIYGGELEFDAELKLYRHLSRLQELEPLNEAELAAWYNGFNGSNVQKFVQFEMAYRNALAPSASEQQQLSTLSADMASLKDEINAIEWFTLEPDGSGTINEAQKALRDAKIAALKGKIVDKAAIVNAKNQALVNQLGSLAAINNGVQLMATVSEQNLKSANAYLLAMHAPSFSGFTEADLSALADIADQCVGEGGEGVLLARGLLASATWAVTEYDDECVQELGEREGGQAPVPAVAQGSLQVFPNPANGTAHIVVPAHLQGQPVAIRNLYGHTVALVETVPGQPSVRLDLSGYAPGMYFAAMEGQNTVRFVVAR